MNLLYYVGILQETSRLPIFHPLVQSGDDIIHGQGDDPEASISYIDI
jgi:hypothetical protein